MQQIPLINNCIIPALYILVLTIDRAVIAFSNTKKNEKSWKKNKVSLDYNDMLESLQRF